MDNFGLPNQTSGLHHSGKEPHILREILLAGQALQNTFSRKVGVPASRLAILRLLAINHPETLGVMAIARSLSVNPAAITRQVNDMENQQLIVRQPDPHDHRRAYLMLTPKGLQLFGEVHKRAHDFEKELQASLSKDDISTTNRILTQIRSRLEQMG